MKYNKKNVLMRGLARVDWLRATPGDLARFTLARASALGPPPTSLPRLIQTKAPGFRPGAAGVAES